MPTFSDVLDFPVSTLPQFVGEDFQNDWEPGLSNEDYHADFSAISSTGLKPILKSPSAWLAHRNKPHEDKDCFRFGSAVHMALLEPDLFKSSIVVMPKFAGEGAHTRRREWKAEHAKSVVLKNQDEKNALDEMVNSVMGHYEASRLIKACSSEVSGYFRHPMTGIKCRIRPDLLNAEMGILLDVKTTRKDCDEDTFAKEIFDFRYDISLAMYQEGIKEITGRYARYPLYLAIESTFPYECALYEVEDNIFQKGLSDFNKAMNLLEISLRTNTFPPYQQRRSKISFPEWIVNK